MTAWLPQDYEAREERDAGLDHDPREPRAGEHPGRTYVTEVSRPRVGDGGVQRLHSRMKEPAPYALGPEAGGPVTMGAFIASMASYGPGRPEPQPVNHHPGPDFGPRQIEAADLEAEP